MSFENFYNKVVLDLVNYLEKKEYNRQKLDKIIENTIFFEYTNPESECIQIQYKDILIKEVLDPNLNNLLGFELPVLIEYSGDIVNAKNIIGIDSKNKKKFRKNILIHELMHLLSQKEEKIGENFFIYTGILCERFKLIDKNVVCDTCPEYLLRINEGITQFLAKSIEKEIYNKHNFNHDCSVYSDIISIFNIFLFNTTNVDEILKIYMNNDKEMLFYLLNSDLGISENFLKMNMLPNIYYDFSKIYLNIKIIKYIRLIIKKSKEKGRKDLKEIREKLILNLSKEKYPYVIWYIKRKLK